MQWQVLRFTELDTLTLYRLLQLRVNVFVVEQNCPYPELDDKDIHPETRHILLQQDDQLLAYARILAPDVSFAAYPSIGRVCIAQTARRKNLGKMLMHKTIAETQQLWPDSDIYISAQCYLQKFYQDLGFQPASEPYLEDNIPHLNMVLVA